jgi:hypothetical protein
MIVRPPAGMEMPMENAPPTVVDDSFPSPGQAGLAGPTVIPTRGVQAPWPRLGRLLHALSHVKFLFWALGAFFQFKTMFLSTGRPFLDNLNRTLLMYGIAMALEGLRDNERMSEKGRRECLTHQAMWRWMIAGIFTGGLFSMAVGCAQFFLTDNRELGWAITTFGLGMVALGRQRYDQFASVLSAAQVPVPPGADATCPGPPERS